MVVVVLRVLDNLNLALFLENSERHAQEIGSFIFFDRFSGFGFRRTADLNVIVFISAATHALPGFRSCFGSGQIESPRDPKFLWLRTSHQFELKTLGSAVACHHRASLGVFCVPLLL